MANSVDITAPPQSNLQYTPKFSDTGAGATMPDLIAQAPSGGAASSDYPSGVPGGLGSDYFNGQSAAPTEVSPPAASDTAGGPGLPTAGAGGTDQLFGGSFGGGANTASLVAPSAMAGQEVTSQGQVVSGMWEYVGAQATAQGDNTMAKADVAAANVQAKAWTEAADLANGADLCEVKT